MRDHRLMPEPGVPCSGMAGGAFVPVASLLCRPVPAALNSIALPRSVKTPREAVQLRNGTNSLWQQWSAPRALVAYHAVAVVSRACRPRM